MTQLILFNVFNGLIIGAFYALMALGLSLILNLSGVINFAHGGFLAIGAYLAFTLMPYCRVLGRAAAGAGVDGAARPRGRTRADPPALWPRSALQPAAHLRPRLHARGRHALYLGPGDAAVLGAGLDAEPAQRTSSSSSPAIGCSWCCWWSPWSRHCSCMLGYTRLGVRIRAGTLDLETVSVLGVNVRVLRNLNFGLGIYPRRPRRRARGRNARTTADHRQRP